MWSLPQTGDREEEGLSQEDGGQSPISKTKETQHLILQYTMVKTRSGVGSGEEIGWGNFVLKEPNPFLKSYRIVML